MQTKWLVAFQAAPLSYTHRRTMVVEAESPGDAQAIVRDDLLRSGDGNTYLGLAPCRWALDETVDSDADGKPKPYAQLSYRTTHQLGVFPYQPPPAGRVLRWG